MATTFQWVAPNTISSYYTTELNSLADNTFVAVGAEIPNETDLFQYVALELILASLSPVVATWGAYVDVWADYALDGTTFADPAKPLQTSAFLCAFQLDTAAATAQRLTVKNVTLAPLDFKLQLRNRAGVAFGASGNILKIRRYNEQGV